MDSFQLLRDHFNLQPLTRPVLPDALAQPAALALENMIKDLENEHAEHTGVPVDLSKFAHLSGDAQLEARLSAYFSDYKEDTDDSK